MGINGTGRNTAALFNNIAFMNYQMSSVRNGVTPFVTVFSRNMNDMNILMIFFFRNRNNAVNFRDNSIALRFTGFKQFFDTRQTLSNIACRCDPAGVEGTHSQLCARFTDRLSRNDTDRLTYIDLTARAEVTTVAFSANAVTAMASKNGTNTNFVVILSDFLRLFFHNFFINGNNHFSRILIE